MAKLLEAATEVADPSRPSSPSEIGGLLKRLRERDLVRLSAALKSDGGDCVIVVVAVAAAAAADATSTATDPTLTSCRAFRWPDLLEKEPLKRLEAYCESDLCINPYHWSRVANLHSGKTDDSLTSSQSRRCGGRIEAAVQACATACVCHVMCHVKCREPETPGKHCTVDTDTYISHCGTCTGG